MPPHAGTSPIARRRAVGRARLTAMLAVAGLAGCAVGRTPLRPAPGSDLARPEGTVDRVVRGVLSRCDTGRVGAPAGGGTARDADPCWRPVADTAGRIRPDTNARVPRVP